MFIRLALLALILCGLTPSTLTAQTADGLRAGIRRAEVSRLAASPNIGPADSTSSAGAHLLVGVLLGAVAGAGIGSTTNKCDGVFMDALCSDIATLQGAVVGGLVGAFIGIVVWQGKQPPSPATLSISARP